MNFVKAKVSNNYIKEGQIYKVQGILKQINPITLEESIEILIQNNNPLDPNVYVDLPLSMFEEYVGQVIQVDFINRKKVG